MDTDALSKAIHTIRRHGSEGIGLALRTLSETDATKLAGLFDDIHRIMYRFWDDPNGPYMRTCDFCLADAADSGPRKTDLVHAADCSGNMLLELLRKME